MFHETRTFVVADVASAEELLDKFKGPKLPGASATAGDTKGICG